MSYKLHQRLHTRRPNIPALPPHIRNRQFRTRAVNAPSPLTSSSAVHLHMMPLPAPAAPSRGHAGTRAHTRHSHCRSGRSPPSVHPRKDPHEAPVCIHEYSKQPTNSCTNVHVKCKHLTYTSHPTDSIRELEYTHVFTVHLPMIYQPNHG